MQAKLLILPLAVIFTALCPAGFAQDFAPASLAGKSAVVVISSGSGDFPSVGGYRIAFGATNGRYVIAGLSSNVSASSGGFTYTKTGANTARLTTTEAPSASPVTETLVFSSPTSATYALSATSGAQAGTFVLENVTSMAPAGSCLINMSVRANVAAGGQVIPGIVVDSPCRLLIRVAGPALAAFGVEGTLPNPKVSLLVGNTVLLTNDNWASSISNYDTVRDAAVKSGAFPFSFGSRDAAFVAELTPGNYTCLITGDPGTSGEVLLEVYRVPQ
jgi:hypothetical protein